MRSRWKLGLLASCLVVVLLLSVSGLFLNGGPLRMGGNAEKTPHIIYIYKTTLGEIEFWKSVSEGIEAGAKEYGVSYSITGPRQESDIEGNIAALQQAIALKPDAIVLAAADYSRLAPAAQQAVDAGILLLTIDSDVEGDIARCYIGTDNYAAGRQMGEELLKRIPAGGKVGLVGHVAEALTTIDRLQGATDVLEEAGCTVLEPVYCDNLSSQAREATLDLLEQHPDIVGFVATNELAAIGMAAAVSAVDAKERIASVTCDHSSEQISYLEQGVIDATVVQKPFNMGYFSVQIVTTLLNDAGDTSVPRMFDTGIEVITLDNYFTPENQKLLFPFWE